MHQLEIAHIIEVKGIRVKAEVYSKKNTIMLTHFGEMIKNVSVGSYVKIIKGYTNIIGIVEGEFIRENKKFESEFRSNNDEFSRYIDVLILGKIENNNFIKGITEMPLLYNPLYILDNEEYKKIFQKSTTSTIEIGRVLSDKSIPVNIEVNNIFNGHIGIFGNTGSGKSNTLAKIYYELFKVGINYENFSNNSKFILFDFNGEYSYNKFLEGKKRVINLDKESDSKYVNKISIRENNFFNEEILSLILDATEKTQIPFLNRVIKFYYNTFYFEFESMSKVINFISNVIFDNKEDLTTVQKYIIEIFNLINIYDLDWLLEFKYNSSTSGLYIGSKKLTDSKDNREFFNNAKEVEEFITKNIGKVEIKANFNYFEKILLSIYYKFLEELSKRYIMRDHIAPLLKRADVKLSKLSSIFEIGKSNSFTSNFTIINLSNSDIEIIKLIPLIVCKNEYDNHIKSNQTKNRTLNFIIDEAHNILSNQSERESTDLKDYRLEVFEGIIKEGRKFGVFLTICSQRPSEISTTLISQINHYFIHRLMNIEDLNKVQNSISFLDKSSSEMISSLPPGACILTGININFPIIVQINILEKGIQPDSENINLTEIWK